MFIPLFLNLLLNIVFPISVIMTLNVFDTQMKTLTYLLTYLLTNGSSRNLNAWRVHELIVGFFSRRELGPPVKWQE